MFDISERGSILAGINYGESARNMMGSSQQLNRTLSTETGHENDYDNAVNGRGITISGGKVNSTEVQTGRAPFPKMVAMKKPATVSYPAICRGAGQRHGTGFRSGTRHPCPECTTTYSQQGRYSWGGPARPPGSRPSSKGTVPYLRKV